MDTSSHPSQDRVFAQFSPKTFFRQIGETSRYILFKWKPVLLVALLLAALGAAYSYFKKVDYVADMTFALDEGAASSTQQTHSGLSELTEALGISQSYDAGGVFSTPSNIVELLSSRLLIEKTLRTSTTIDGHTISFADFFLDSLEYRDKWLKDKPHYYKQSFPIPNGSRSDTLFENSLYQAMFEVLIAKNIKVDKVGKGSTLYEATCTSHNELFSKLFLENLMQQVKNYYVDVKTERAQINLEFIQQRLDSIQRAYNKSLTGRASYYDEHINPALQIARVAQDKQQTDIQILKTTYVDLNRSLEAAKTTLIRETPLIQYVDQPILPLKKLRSSPMKFGLIGFFAGLFLAGGFFGLRKAFEYMK